jgi:outer membrane protein assembly factor BamB
VIFALSGGKASTSAVLYALDPSTGKEVWNSGKSIGSYVASGGLSAGGSQVYVGAADGTLYAFGFPMEH